jgi:hypothetical protein
MRIEQDLMGGYDDVEYAGIEELINLIDSIKELDERAYKFVITNILRRGDN